MKKVIALKKRVFLLLISLVLLLSGCIEPKVTYQQSAMIVWKSPSFRYADMGFISDSGDRLEIEIYGSGVAVMSLNITDESICMSRFKCISPKQFNLTELSKYYPDTLLKNIFKAKPIYNKENLNKNRNGFTQKIEKLNQYSIEYTVSTNETIFRDKMNKILIKVIKQ